MARKLSYNTREAAKETGLSVDTIKRAIRSGALRAKRSGRLKGSGPKGNKGDPAGSYVIPDAALRDWLDALEDA